MYDSITDKARHMIARTYAYVAYTLLVCFGFATYGAIHHFTIVIPHGIISFIIMVAILVGLIYLAQFLAKLSVIGGLIGLTLIGLFYGALLVLIFEVFPSAIIIQALLSTVGLFVILSFVGFATKVDLSKFGTIACVSLLAMIIIDFINSFVFHSQGLNLIISSISILVFGFYTAYDTQNMKDSYDDSYDFSTLNQISVSNAINLFLDFIQLFLDILQLLSFFEGDD